MKTVILAGGFGTRISEYTGLRPKPMVEIGHQPLLWHIMNIYAAQGFTDFIIACGYLGEVIKDYFHNYAIRHTDFTIRLRDGVKTVLASDAPNWTVALIDTGLETMTGGRLRRLRPYIEHEPFMVTYGDGVADIDVRRLVDFHRSHGKLATVTAVRPPARFGAIELDNGWVKEFSEKPQSGAGWINGGFFVFELGVFDYIDGDQTPLERAPLERLASDGQLMAYRHEGFWHCMDTARDMKFLNELWSTNKAPWKSW